MDIYRAEWSPEIIESDELATQYRAATELTRCDIPPWLSKQLANLRVKISVEMSRRGIDVDNPVPAQ